MTIYYLLIIGCSSNEAHMLICELTLITRFIGTYSFSTKLILPYIISLILALASAIFYCKIKLKFINENGKNYKIFMMIRFELDISIK